MKDIAGYDDHFDVFGLSGRPQNIQHVKARNLGHHHVTDDQGRAFFDSHSQSLFTVARRNDVVALS